MRIVVDARPLSEPLQGGATHQTVQGGVGRVALELVRALAADNPADEIVCATTGSQRPVLQARLLALANVRQIHLNIPNKIWSAACAIGAVSLFRQIQKRCGKADAFFMPNLGFVGSLPEQTPTVLLLHDLSFLVEPRWFGWKQRLWHRAIRVRHLIRGATRLIAVSETTKRDAMRLLDIPADKINVIPIGATLPDAAFDPSYKLQATSFPARYCLALGLGDRRKNAATAIEAVRQLRREKGFEDMELVIVGGSRREKKDVIPTEVEGSSNWKVSRHARDDNFSWIQVIPQPTDPELAALYQNAAAFLYPSWYEGYGLPLHEAARCGTPRVASTSGALPETAPAGTLFANPAKPQHWVEALKLSLSRSRTEATTERRTWHDAARILRQALEI